jgi:hypothetical protein
MSEQYVTTTLPSGAQITVLVADPIVGATVANSRVTKLAFRNRFTPAEKAALYTAAKTSVDIQIYLDDVNAATFIDLQRTDTRASVHALESLGLIAAGRADQILDAPVTPDEAPR